jgi:hypothetical protein
MGQAGRSMKLIAQLYALPRLKMRVTSRMALDSYLGDAQFESWQGRPLSWQSFSLISSVTLSKYQDSTSVRPRLLLSKSFPNYYLAVIHSRPPLWSSGQGSWLQIQRSGFDFQRCQIFWEVVDLERGLLSLVRITEELFQGNSGSGLENWN